jgi:hypothetical protein
MTTIALSVELQVDIPGSKITSKVKSVHDAAGTDRTSDFRQFCKTASLLCNTQSEIELALHEYVKAGTHSLP